MANENFEEMIKAYNLTNEELEIVKAQNDRESFDPAGLKEFIEHMRRDHAIALVGRNDKIDYDELQVAWATVKDAKEDDAELFAAKTALQNKSEEIMQAVDPNVMDMATAPEIEEWLAINNTLGNKENAARNKALAKRLQTFYKQYDKENGLSSVSPTTAEEILATQKALKAQYAGFAEDESVWERPEFAAAKEFYDKLVIQNVEDDVEHVSKEQYKKDMLELAKQEAITELSKNPDFMKLPEEQRNALFYKTSASFMEEGAVSMLMANTVKHFSADGQENGFNKEDVEKACRKYFEQVAEASEIPLTNGVVLAAYKGRQQEVVNQNKRIAQKTGVRGAWGGVKGWWKKFDKEHPKLAGAAKFAGNLGLTVGANYLLGGTGLAIVGAYRTYKAVQEAKQARDAEGSDKNLLKYIMTSRHGIKVAGALASTVLSGVGALQSWDANGLVGQAINHGGDAVLGGIQQGWHNTLNIISHPVDSIGKVVHTLQNNLGDEHAASLPQKIVNKTINMFSTENKLKFSRTLLSLGTAGATFGADISDMMKPENKGKRGKMFLKAFVKAGITFGAVWSTSSTEAPNAHAAAATDGSEMSSGGGAHGSATESGADLPPDVVEHNFDEVFQGENRENLEHAVKSAPSLVVKHLQEEGVLSDDYQLRSSSRLMKDIEAAYAQRGDAQELSEFVQDRDKFTQAMKEWNHAHRQSFKQEIKSEFREKLGDELEEKIAEESKNEEVPVIVLEEDSRTETEERTEQYYKEERKALNPKGGDSLKHDLNEARKSGSAIDEAISSHFDEQENLSEQQKNDLKNYAAYKVDMLDGEADREVDHNITRRDIRHINSEVKSTLNSLRENAEEIKLADAIQNTVEVTPNEETFSTDTKSPKFYAGMAKVVEDVQGSDMKAHKAFAQALENGDLSSQQAAQMNARYGELQAKGMGQERILKTMLRDYRNIEEFRTAQNMDYVNNGAQSETAKRIEEMHAARATREAAAGTTGSEEETPQPSKTTGKSTKLFSKIKGKGAEM